MSINDPPIWGIPIRPGKPGQIQRLTDKCVPVGTGQRPSKPRFVDSSQHLLLGRSLAARLGTWNAAVTAVAAYLLVVLVGGSLLPTVNETPEGFPAAVLYDFRIAALGVHVVLWSVLGLVFGALVERGARREQQVLAGR